MVFVSCIATSFVGAHSQTREYVGAHNLLLRDGKSWKTKYLYIYIYTRVGKQSHANILINLINYRTHKVNIIYSDGIALLYTH